MPNSHRRLSVSVIIPTYNRADLVAEAVESALRQTRQPDEIVVVDDGSIDNTLEVLSQFGPPVVVVPRPHRSHSAARNHGMKIATGDVFLFLDSDDLMLPNCVERTAQSLEDHPAVDVVYSDCYLIDRSENRLGVYSRVEPGERPSGIVLGQLGYRWFVINISSAGVRRSALRDITFDEGLSVSGEDFEFWRRLAAQSRFLFLDEILSCYRYHAGQITAIEPAKNLEGALEVQRRIMEMPEFVNVPRGEKARLYCFHGVKHAECGRGRIARQFFLRSILASPGYLAAYALLGFGLFGTRSLQSAIRARRRWFKRRVDANVGKPATKALRPASAFEVASATSLLPATTVPAENSSHG